MSEEDTFNTLKRTPLQEMMQILAQTKYDLPPMMMILNSIPVDQPSYYRSLSRLDTNLRILSDHGWDYKDFITELERDMVTTVVSQYNASLVFPADIIAHARIYFPNIKFTPAKIELE